MMPPATISVVTGWHNTTSNTPWPTMNWSSSGWIDDPATLLPTNSILEVATKAAIDKAIVPLNAPGLNSSYHMNFHGPSMQCQAANSSQQVLFDNYALQLANVSAIGNEQQKSQIMTQTVWESATPKVTDLSVVIYPLAWSAFAPNLGQQGWFRTADFENGDLTGVDQFNNWPMTLDSSFEDLTQFPATLEFQSNGLDMVDDNAHITTQQLWIQTADQGIVCILGNASYDLDITYVDGVQDIHTETSEFVPLWMPGSNLTFIGHSIERRWGYLLTTDMALQSTTSYVAVFTALSSLLSGNITLSLEDDFDAGTTNLGIEAMSSKVLLTALSACPEAVPSYWFNDTNLDSISIDRPGEEGHLINATVPVYTHAIEFDQPASLCRNKTLMRAIEDLFNNITISMLAANIS